MAHDHVAEDGAEESEGYSGQNDQWLYVAAKLNRQHDENDKEGNQKTLAK